MNVTYIAVCFSITSVPLAIGDPKLLHDNMKAKFTKTLQLAFANRYLFGWQHSTVPEARNFFLLYIFFERDGCFLQFSSTEERCLED